MNAFPRTASLMEFFLVRIEKTETCWLWKGFINQKGYGKTRPLGYKNIAAHRLAFELFRGPIPSGLTLDHLCRNRSCVNPSHLEPVTAGENTLRGNTVTGINLRKTHCKCGSLFSEKRDSNGGRVCIVCKRRNDNAYRKRLREKQRAALKGFRDEQ